MKPVANIVTDLASLDRLWVDKEVNLCLVPTKTAADIALERGLAADRVQFTGLPVNPALADRPESKSELRMRLGWDPDLFTVLAVGDNRVERLDRFVDILNHAGFAYQITAVAGGNDALYETWQGTEWHVPTRVYDIVENMSDFLLAAFIMHVIPGEEMGNAQLVVGGEAGEIVLEPLELLEGMAHWLADDRRLYRERAANARRLGRPRAAYDAADLIWKLAKTGF
jgi:1,2-diacylglycerol 3-beta-galactosyltransferase